MRNLVLKTPNKIGLATVLVAGVLLWGFQAQAKPPAYSYVPQKSASQKSLVKSLKSKKYSEALKAWTPAFQSERFPKTYTGQALQAYLMFKSDMPILALEKLMNLKKPRHIQNEVRQLWREAAPATHPAWKQAKVSWSDKWAQVFPTSVKASIESRPVFALSKKTQLKVILKKLKQAPQGSARETALKWQLAQWAPVFNKEDLALDALMDLSESKQSIINKDQIYLTMGRVLYQRGDLNEAIQVYDKVSKGSDYYLEALEEKAWAYLRLKKPGKALGELESLMTPVFADQVGPEPYFLSSLINLKVCDFPQVFKNSKTFKKQFSQRVKAVQNLAKTGESPAATQAIDAIVTQGFGLKVLAPHLASLPRLFHKDEFFQRHLSYAHALKTELTKAQKLLSPSDEKNQKLLAQATQRIQQAKEAAKERVQKLAQAEAEEFSTMIRKMHLVEAEVIQRIHRSFELADNGDKPKGDANVLVFPKDKESQEVWLDEIGHYQVNVKDCLNKEGRTL